LAIVGDTPELLQIGAAVGLLGALAFVWFTVDVTRYLLRRP